MRFELHSSNSSNCNWGLSKSLILFDGHLDGPRFHVRLMRTRCHPGPPLVANRNPSEHVRRVPGGSFRKGGGAQAWPRTPGAAVGHAAWPWPSPADPDRVFRKLHSRTCICRTVIPAISVKDFLRTYLIMFDGLLNGFRFLVRLMCAQCRLGPRAIA